MKKKVPGKSALRHGFELNAMLFLRPLWPFDHVLNIMLCFLCLFVLLYDIGIKFDMILKVKVVHEVITRWLLGK